MPGRFEGEGHPNARLTEARVLRMREAMRAALARDRELRRRRPRVPSLEPTGLVAKFAERYRVSHGAVSMAISGRTWKHLKGAVPPRRRGAHA